MHDVEAALQEGGDHHELPHQDRGCDVTFGGFVLPGVDHAFVVYLEDHMSASEELRDREEWQE